MAKKTNVKEVKEVKEVREVNSPLPSVQPIGDDEIGAPEIAKMLGVDPREFRAFLRSHKRDMEVEKGTRYAWKRGSKEVKALIAEYTEFAANKPVKETKAPKAKAKKEEVEEEIVTGIDLEDEDEEEEDEDLSLDDLEM